MMLFALFALCASAVVVVLAVAFWQPNFLVDTVHNLLLPSKASHGVLFRVKIKKPETNKVVALTLDDAPHGTLTPAILDVLKENDCKATFFCIGKHIKNVDAGLVKRMRDEGHELANHLMKDEAAISLSPEEFERQLLETDELIQPPHGWRQGEVRWFRPGHGWCNKRMVKQAEAHGYRVALGNCYPFDPQTRNATISKWFLKAKVSPGSVIILHDGAANRTFTVAVLKEILPYLKEKGYKVVTLTDLVSYECE